MPDRLTRRFYQRDPVTVAKALLGQHLVRVCKRRRLVGRIVEVEAYLGIEDRAAHTFGGRRTARNASMWGPAGHAYVYFTYGMHHCVNVVAQGVDHPTAVLIRALEPIDGINLMRKHRSKKIAADRLRQTDLCSGPAKLAQALAITRKLDGADLVEGDELFIEKAGRVAPSRIITATRIGVAYAGEWADRPLRFYEAGNPHVSRR
jgi:DNA-3-methyladenine glycosylase